MSNFHKMVDNTFALMVSTAHQIGDHFARSNLGRDKVRLWCDDARRELVGELGGPNDLETRVCLDAIDRVLDVVEARAACST